MINLDLSRIIASNNYRYCYIMNIHEIWKRLSVRKYGRGKLFVVVIFTRIYLTDCLGAGGLTGARVKDSLFFLFTRRPTCRTTSPAFTDLNSAIASAWVIPWRGFEFIDKISSPTNIENFKYRVWMC